MLDGELDQFLAGEYGIKNKTKSAFDAWRSTHQPFHWFVHFYSIMRDGGFDVIIGNPPYVEYKDVRDRYTVRSFATLDCGDLYAFCTERAVALLRERGRFGLIVPISIFGTDGFRSLQALLVRSCREMWISSFANRPSQLFDGAQKRLTIVVGTKSSSGAVGIHTTRYIRWRRDEFDQIFRARLEYAPAHDCFSVFPASLEKLGSAIEVHAFQHILSRHQTLAAALADEGLHRVFYTRKFGYFLAFLDFVPEVREIRTRKELRPTELKDLALRSQESVAICIAVLSSSTFFWFWNVLSDCRNLNRRDLLAFRMNPEELPGPLRQALASLGHRYLRKLKATSRTMTKSGLELETFEYSAAKPIVDEIDRALARYFDLSELELDFIVNYDIKYRVGADDGVDDL